MVNGKKKILSIYHLLFTIHPLSSYHLSLITYHCPFLISRWLSWLEGLCWSGLAAVRAGIRARRLLSARLSCSRRLRLQVRSCPLIAFDYSRRRTPLRAARSAPHRLAALGAGKRSLERSRARSCAG